MNKALLPFKVLGLILLGGLGVWLVYWNIVETLTLFFNTGAWHPEIIINGFPSIFIGVIIVIIVAFLGVRVLK